MNILLAVIAVAAVVFGPLVSIYISKRGAVLQLDIAKRQIRSQTVSASRQAWIDALRNDVSEYLSLLVEMSAYPPRAVELFSKIVLLETRVNLRLNRREKPHDDLSVRMTKSRRNARSVGDIAKGDSEALKQAVETSVNDVSEIRKLTSFILKQEWGRIKKGE